MYPYVGAIAGATLGFIHNNLKGAYKYGRLGHRAGRWRQTRQQSRPQTLPNKNPQMARPYRKRKLGGRLPFKVTKGGTQVKRRKVTPAARPSVTRTTRTRKAGGAKKQYTKRRRTYRRSAKQDPHAVDASFSNARYGPGPRVYSGFKPKGVRNAFSSTTTGRMSSTINTQTVAYPNNWTAGGNTGTVNPTQRDGNGYGVTSNLIDYVKKELRNQLPVVSGLPAALPYGQSQMRFAIYELSMTYEIKNQTNNVVHLTLYDCAARPGTLINDIDTPLDAWNEGNIAQGGPTGNVAVNAPVSTTLMVPTATPFQSKKFCKFWRVYGVKSLILHPGHTHQHKVTIMPRNTWTMEDETVSGTSNNWIIPGVTTASFFVLKGGVAHDRDTPGAVGFHQAAVDYICRSQCKFGLLEKTTKLRNVFTRLGQVTNAQTTGEEDVSTGLVTTA